MRLLNFLDSFQSWGQCNSSVTCWLRADAAVCCHALMLLVGQENGHSLCVKVCLDNSQRFSFD